MIGSIWLLPPYNFLQDISIGDAWNKANIGNSTLHRQVFNKYNQQTSWNWAIKLSEWTLRPEGEFLLTSLTFVSLSLTVFESVSAQGSDIVHSRAPVGNASLSCLSKKLEIIKIKRLAKLASYWLKMKILFQYLFATSSKKLYKSFFQSALGATAFSIVLHPIDVLIWGHSIRILRP